MRNNDLKYAYKVPNYIHNFIDLKLWEIPRCPWAYKWLLLRPVYCSNVDVVLTYKHHPRKTMQR